MRLIRDLVRADFVRNRQNVILLSRCGTGKTHLAIALGMARCQHNYAVRFTTGYNLANDLSEARSERLRSHCVGRYSRYNLLILDELGYIPFTGEGAELLFQVLTERYERGSVIITTNLGFADWTQIFGDATMTAALLDRLTHRAVIISCDWESYRLKQSLKGCTSYDLTAKPETRKDVHPPAVTGKGPRDPLGTPDPTTQNSQGGQNSVITPGQFYVVITRKIWFASNIRRSRKQYPSEKSGLQAISVGDASNIRRLIENL